jgi:hypothetical protein
MIIALDEALAGCRRGRITRTDDPVAHDDPLA